MPVWIPAGGAHLLVRQVDCFRLARLEACPTVSTAPDSDLPYATAEADFAAGLALQWLVQAEGQD